MFRRFNIDEERNNRTFITANSTNIEDTQQERNQSNQYRTYRNNRLNTEQKNIQKNRKKSSSPAVDCLDQIEIFCHSAHDKQLIDWIKNNLNELGIDPVYYTSLILALLNKTPLQDLSSQQSDIAEINRPDLLRANLYSNRNRHCDNTIYRLCNSREKLFVNDRKTVNNHQAPSSTTKFMHKRYQDSLTFQNKRFTSEEFEEDFHFNLGNRSKSREISEKLFHYLKDATDKDSAAIELFVNELLERFEGAATGVAQQHHSEWMLATDMDQKRRPISNNDFGSKSTQPNNSNTSIASNSTNNNQREDSWHRNTGRNFRSVNQDINQTNNLKNHDAHKYFNAFPALSEERIQSQNKSPVNTDHSNHNRTSKSNHWNGMKIIKNVVDPAQTLSNQNNNSINDNTNFTTLTSKSANTFAGKPRIIVAPSTNKSDKTGELNNMVTLKKVSTGKKSGISNSPARYETNVANSKLQLDASTKKKITKEDEKILSVMPNFMNPLKKNDLGGGGNNTTTTAATVTTTTNTSSGEQYRSKEDKPQNWNSSGKNGNIQQEVSSPSGSVRNAFQHELTQKQREFFDSKFVKRSNSFGTREMKKYGFSDETKKKNSGASSLRNNNNSQPSCDDIDSDWRAQKSAVSVQHKNPLSASNALLGVMPSYLKSVATADAEKVTKIEHKTDSQRTSNIKSTTVSQQDESSESSSSAATSLPSTVPSTITTSSTSKATPNKPVIETKTLVGLSSEEISKFLNGDSNMNFFPMCYEGIFDDDDDAQYNVLKNYLDFGKQLRNEVTDSKNSRKYIKSDDMEPFESRTPAETEINEKNAIDNLMKEMNDLVLKSKTVAKTDSSNDQSNDRVYHVPYSKRKKYENGGAENFGRFPLSIEELEAEHERLKNTANFEYFEISTSSNEDLSIAYMFEREPDYDGQFIMEEGYDEAHEHHLMIDQDNEEDNEADYYAIDYENFLAEKEKTNAEAGRIGFNDFVTANRIIDNTIDSVQKTQKPCKYLLEGFCARSDCKFSHNFSDIVCRYWLEGFCVKEHDCPFKHSIDKKSQMNHFQSQANNAENYELDIDGDFPALAKNNIQHQQNPTEMIGNPYFNNHNHTQNGKNVVEEWPTLEMNGGRQTQAYSSSVGNIYPSTMDSFGINFKIAKKKNRKDKSKFKN